MTVQLTQQQQRHLTYLERPLEMPLSALDELSPEQIAELSIELEKRVIESAALLSYWDIPKMKLSPGMTEISPHVHPLEYAWWKLHERWMRVLDALPGSVQCDLADSRAVRRDAIRKAILDKIKAAPIGSSAA